VHQLLTVCRGAAGSGGRTSWTGKPELGDFVSVYGFALHYVNAIDQLDKKEGTTRPCTPTLILGGYSYGSMIASHAPCLKVVVGTFESAAPDSAQHEIQLRAQNLAHDARAYFDMHSASGMLNVPISPGRRGRDCNRKPPAGVVMGGYDSEATSRRVSRENSRKSIDAERIRQSVDRVRRKISAQHAGTPSTTPPVEAPSPDSGAAPTPVLLPNIAYLIVSPILSVAASLTTMFSKLKFTTKNGQVDQGSHKEDFHELTCQPCCCIYGNKDTFTSARRLQRWTSELSSRPGSRVTAIEAEAGHFWHEPGGVVQLKRGLAEFLEGIAPRCAPQSVNGQLGEGEEL
jgi:alpha/beta superfamily hydrolase